MKHYSTTNLLKGSLTRACKTGLILASLFLAACNSRDQPEKACPLVGSWKISALENAESAHLDQLSRKIYEQELNKMLDSSSLVISLDSTYHLRIGPDSEQGKWKWDNQDSLLRLETHKGRKNYYILQSNGHQSFKLKKDLDPQKLVLSLERLPD